MEKGERKVASRLITTCTEEIICTLTLLNTYSSSVLDNVKKRMILDGFLDYEIGLLEEYVEELDIKTLEQND